MRIDGLDQFIEDLNAAVNGGLQAEYEEWLEAMGYEFLDIVQDEDHSYKNSGCSTFAQLIPKGRPRKRLFNE